MTVRALRDIAPGEQLTVSYINLMEPRQIPGLLTNSGHSPFLVRALLRCLRQQLLQGTRYFTCACSRCTEDIHPSADKLLEVYPLNYPKLARSCTTGCAMPCFQVPRFAGWGLG